MRRITLRGVDDPERGVDGCDALRGVDASDDPVEL